MPSLPWPLPHQFHSHHRPGIHVLHYHHFPALAAPTHLSM
jgi:hypothetical protein